jgi:hypothetical protein
MAKNMKMENLRAKYTLFSTDEKLEVLENGSSSKIYNCYVANVCTYVHCSPTGISNEIPAYSRDELVSEDKWKHIRLLCCRQLIPDTIVLCVIQCLQLHIHTCIVCT